VTRVRIAAAIAALLSCLAVQAAVIAPLSTSAAVSLPALLVAAVALSDGPGTGIAFGFAAGLVADLGSNHPAGVFALTWMGVGMLCGLAADKTSVRTDAVIATALCAVAASMGTALLTLLKADGATLGLVFREFLPTALGDGLLAIVLVPLVRRALRAELLRAPRVPVVLLGMDS